MPIVELPPGRFSTITGWPNSMLTLVLTSRTEISETPPGAYGTITRIGRAG
jgi:hypothetical protein